ncbi:hypothetical protein QCD60_12815 [Pokkaliibacter sp. MBI-7]|uniref:tetratricopeptide repeat protein n=1 Tax=Pokkaliibacter sp. MBI-7 TaxID=3040600 RepID=UPI00244B3FC3|nr:tetratricopeptide repeat protein [Pokkaliibacter sp. MBI-7]MDH2433455.1 hypothetical protein [Pokkaliibacter sp. MBI-7]
MKTAPALLKALALSTLLGSGLALADGPADTALHTLQQDWAVANYQHQGKDRETALAKLSDEARQFAGQYPDSAEIKVWEAISLSTYAGAKGGLGALGLVKDAKAILEDVIAHDPDTLDGSAFTTLGSLYYQVPGWPIGFGNSKKAAVYLQEALKRNPSGIDPNYFYADYMLDQGKKDEARKYFEKALKAPDRPGRELADQGRRQEIADKLKKLGQ